MSVKLLTEHHLEFLRLKLGCTGSSESTLVKIPYCWKSHAAAHLFLPYQWDDIMKTRRLSCQVLTKPWKNGSPVSLIWKQERPWNVYLKIIVYKVKGMHYIATWQPILSLSLNKWNNLSREPSKAWIIFFVSPHLTDPKKKAQTKKIISIYFLKFHCKLRELSNVNSQLSLKNILSL